MKLNLWRVVIFFGLIGLIIFFVVYRTITPIFFSLAEVEVKNLTNEAINLAVAKEIENINYQDIIDYIYNDQGDIVLMQPNIKTINNFITRISLSIQEKMQVLSRKNVSVPLGRILGIDILAGYGPNIKLKIVPAGYTIPPQLEDSFSSAGINQTRHKIYLKLVAQVKLIVPFNSKSIDVTAHIPVTEVVILGRVPKVYVGMEQEGLSGILNK